jgi:hypothetical protein
VEISRLKQVHHTCHPRESASTIPQKLDLPLKNIKPQSAQTPLIPKTP